MSEGKGKIIAWIETPMKSHTVSSILWNTNVIVDVDDNVLVLRELPPYPIHLSEPEDD